MLLAIVIGSTNQKRHTNNTALSMLANTEDVCADTVGSFFLCFSSERTVRLDRARLLFVPNKLIGYSILGVMDSSLLIIGILIGLGFVGLFFALKSVFEKFQQAQLQQLVDSAFGMSAQKITEQSKAVLSAEKAVIKEDLNHKHKELQQLVERLQKDIEKRQGEIRDLEQDRIKSFSKLTTAMDEQRKLTEDLKISADQLSKVLSNNQQRGEWGERIIEELLEANGMVEGTHYQRQTKLGSSSLRPDITLLLPNDRVVAVDVKFPYSEIQKIAESTSKSARSQHLKQFRSDLKIKIDKVAEYISPEDDTLDYAILFVPNEMVFSFINQKLLDMVDYAMSKRVLMVSPVTFIIVARTVKESYRNFMIVDTLREIVKHVDEFVVEWGRFKGKFEKYGKTLSTLQSDYAELTGTRVRQMERRIEKIDSYRQGTVLPE